VISTKKALQLLMTDLRRVPRDQKDGFLGRAGDRLGEVLLRLFAYKPNLDGRFVAFAIVALYLLTIAVPRVLWGIDIWPWLGVPSGPSRFFDTRNITAAVECRRLGFDPLVSNPCDPWDRPMVYPRIWLALRWLGLNQSDTDLMAVIIVLLFLASLWLLIGRISGGQGLLLAAVVCSPAVMLAIERTNMDLAVFVILALAVLTWRSRRIPATVGPALVLIAAVAKIYPVFALGAYFIAGKRRAALAAIVCSGAFAVYAVVTLDDILAVAKAAPQGEYHSYGARILLARLYHLVVPEGWGGGEVVAQALAMIPLLAITISLWIWVRRRYSPPDKQMVIGHRRLGFYFGALLFLGTFSLGNNFDYRLVFLLLTIPQLFQWIVDERDQVRGRLAAVCLTNELTLVWVGALSQYILLADEIVSWTLTVVLALLLATSVPKLSSLWHLLVPTTKAKQGVVA
jgi:hypothetical protein